MASLASAIVVRKQGSRSSGIFLSLGLLVVMIRFWKRIPLARALQQQPMPASHALLDRLSCWIQQTFAVGSDENNKLLHNENRGLREPSTRAMSDASPLLETGEEIQRVLKFWFGQYPPDEAQKKLWMISSQSQNALLNVDAEIANNFACVLGDLSSSDATRDAWCSTLYGYQGKVAAIVVLDQFSRHIIRHHSRENEQRVPELASQDVLDKLALEVAQSLVDQHKEELTSGMVPVPMHVFALMPYRHANKIETVQFVQSQIDVADQLMQQSNSMLRRFRSATARRMAVLQDEARRGTATEAAGAVRAELTYEDDSILEVAPFEADFTAAPNHAVHQTIRAFLERQGIVPPQARGDDGPVVDSSEKKQPIIVSLSGGVDSMVIAAVLAHIAGSYQLDVVAVHIDYANRPESGAEAAYVETFCKKLGIIYKCRRIDEVTRGITARDAYEKIAREARYSFYRQTVQEFCSSATTPAGVVLGHHRGDLRENVLSNSHKGSGPLDLSGMTAVSQNDGVKLFRPLLLLEKSAIFDYAHTFGVPYFKDTTPHWSTRGKLRNKLLPLLQEIYGEGSMNNLSNLAVASDQCRELVQALALDPFLKSVDRKPMGLSLETNPWKNRDNFFWKFVLREMLHSGGLGMFTDKMVISFLERVQAKTVREGWLQCRKDYAVYLERSGRVHVLYPASFPFRKADAFDCIGETVCFGEDNAVHVGPWKVSAHLIQPSAGDFDATALRVKLEKRAIYGMDDLMAGSLEYYLPVSPLATSAVFTRFTKATRPRAWKSIDPKIQETLPLLGNTGGNVQNATSSPCTSTVLVRMCLDQV